MGSYMIIAETGNALVQLLRKELVPEVIANGDGIGLASPADRGDLNVCVHLYDISESEDYRLSGMQSEGLYRQKFPPVYLTLSYMITAFSASDVKFRSGEEHRILGRILQALRDYPVFDPNEKTFGIGGNPDGIRMEMRRIEPEEKLKIWNFPNLANRLSLFYKIGPVPLESSRTREVSRVRSVQFGLSGQEDET